MGQPLNRSFGDALLVKSKALPAAGASASTDAIDFEAVTPFPATEGLDVVVSLPATPNLVDGKTITITLEDSANNSSFAAVTGLSTLVVTGAGGAGAAAAERRVKLPPGARRYLRATAAVEAAGGDNSAVSFTLSVVG